jgi:hypothetical protein
MDIVLSLEIREVGARSIPVQLLDFLIPVWSAGIQADLDVSGRILAKLDAGHLCRMTRLSTFMFCGQRKLMKYFVVSLLCQIFALFRD